MVKPDVGSDHVLAYCRQFLSQAAVWFPGARILSVFHLLGGRQSSVSAVFHSACPAYTVDSGNGPTGGASFTAVPPLPTVGPFLFAASSVRSQCPDFNIATLFHIVILHRVSPTLLSSKSDFRRTTVVSLFAEKGVGYYMASTNYYYTVMRLHAPLAYEGRTLTSTWVI